MLKAVTVTVMLHQGQQHSESLSPSYIRSFHVLGNTIFRYNYFQYWALGMLFKIEPIIFLSSIKCVVKCFSVCFFPLIRPPFLDLIIHFFYFIVFCRHTYRFFSRFKICIYCQVGGTKSAPTKQI